MLSETQSLVLRAGMHSAGKAGAKPYSENNGQRSAFRCQHHHQVHLLSIRELDILFDTLGAGRVLFLSRISGMSHQR